MSDQPSLRKLSPPLRVSYRSGRDDLVNDFFVPCLCCATRYDRAVGYFTSGGLACAAAGISSLITRRGQMRLVASPHLEERDLEALQRAGDHPHDVLRDIVARTLDEVEDLLVRDRLNALAWLVAAGSLEIRLALRHDASGRPLAGLYHEKMGLFADAAGDQIAFAGSSNETAGGLVNNFESLKVFWSWDDPHGRVREEAANFEALWNDETPGLKVWNFTDISRDLLKRYRLSTPPRLEEPPGSYRISKTRAAVRPGQIPADLDLREYQRQAIRAWLQAGGKGIMAMATGTGKTLTALYLACKVAEKNSPLVVLVVCPYLNLAQQWGRELGRFGLTPVACFHGRSHWETPLRDAYARVTAGLDPVMAIVTTNATFQSSAFRAALQPKLAAHLLIADEVHNLGATRLQQALPDAISMRLGLSATPERHGDAEGTLALLNYFGDVVFTFSLADAIAQGVLVPYDYHPVLVDLTPTETETYRQLSVRIARAFAQQASGAKGSDHDAEGLADAPALKLLLIQRARLIASAANKLPALAGVLTSMNAPVEKALFYCGDGTVEQPLADEENQRQILAVTRLLGDTHGLRVRKFTCEESAPEREEMLSALRNGQLQALIAIRCLDEGIDVPDVRLGFLLASSTNPRQFVQRRGRLLRRAPGKTHAVLYDFLVRPPALGDSSEDVDGFNLERAMFRNELKRVLEFCGSARNGPAALHELQGLRLEYNLLTQ